MSIIEVLDDCPTTYGRRNKFRSVVDMMKRLKEIAVPVAAAAKMTAEQLAGKVLTGVLYKEDKPGILRDSTPKSSSQGAGRLITRTRRTRWLNDTKSAFPVPVARV
jgi:pyruvate/2-oxoacid:ferredoxin oxidoreductase beta subunit